MTKSELSRREFARRAAIISAATLVSTPEIPAAESDSAPSAAAAQAQTEPNLTLPSQSEADLRTNAVLSQYGSRLSDSQKAELAKLSTAAQRQLDRIRAFPTANGDDPALYLKPLVEHEKNVILKPPPPSSAPSTGLTPPSKKP